MGLHIVCLLKPTLPTEAKIALNAAGRASDERAKPIINPYDEFAVEEAVQWKEKKLADSVTLLTVATEAGKEPVLRGLAMGADKAIFIKSEPHEPSALDGATTAAALAAALKNIKFDLLFCGRIAVDSGAGEVPGRLAELLGLPLIHVASKIEMKGADTVLGNREADGRTEIVEAKLPAIVSADKSLNKPRYPNLPSIMQAKKKPFETLTLDSLLGGAAAPKRIVSHRLPAPRGAVKMIEGGANDAAAALVKALRDEAKAL